MAIVIEILRLILHIYPHLTNAGKPKHTTNFMIRLLTVPLLLLSIYFISISITNGYGQGKAAALVVLLSVPLVYKLLYRRSRSYAAAYRPLLILFILASISFVLYTLIPVASDDIPARAQDFPGVRTKYWNLKTGSRIACYQIPAKAGSKKKNTPIIFLHGGPGVYVRQIDLDFFSQFAEDGYDVYLYDQVGAGRSGLLPKAQYSHRRNVEDAEQLMQKIGASAYIMIGQSYGGALLAHLLGRPQTAAKISRAIFAEPGSCIPATGAEIISKSPTALAEPVTVPIRVFLGWLINPRGNFTSQNEVINYFASHPDLLQRIFREAFPLQDKSKIPKVEYNIVNFSIVGILSREITGFDPELEKHLSQTAVPAMLMLGRSSYIIRNAPLDLLRIYPGIRRSQYFKDAGHILWNGLHHNNEKVKTAIDEFLNDIPPTIPNYPQRKDIAQFLKERR